MSDAGLRGMRGFGTGRTSTRRRDPILRGQLLRGVSLVALAAGLFAGMPARAATPATFSGAWFANHAASSGAGAAVVAAARANAAFNPQNYAQLTQSLANLRQAAQTIAAMRSLQSAAHALVAASSVPNGLALGGLVPDSGLARAGVANAVSSWTGAVAPVQTGSAARPTVTIRQTAAQAILNWSSFNVGAGTTLAFDQSAGGASASSWVALNRVSGAAPSDILGKITAQGHVLILNNNGILFGSGAQVNVGTLIASTASLSASANGIYSPASLTPSFTGAGGDVVVAQGAEIATNAPLTATSAGGGVILLGRNVSNEGDIETPNGQVILGAGKDFVLRQGYSATQDSKGNLQGNLTSTVVGSEIAVADGGGTATNTGLLEADIGDVTMVGAHVAQNGVALSTTTVAQRGTIHLLTDKTDPNASVSIGAGALTSITPDANSGTAFDAQRAADVANSNNANNARAGATLPSGATAESLLDDQVALPDAQYESLVQIVSGNTVDFQPGSLTLSKGGQITASAPGRMEVETGAVLDVSGTVGVSLPMSANNVAINIQGFDLRDAPVNRDTTVLNNSNVYLDVRGLLTVEASSAYANSPYTSSSRLYTPGGLLEAGSQVGNLAHSIDEWTTPGGAILLSGPLTGTNAAQVVAQPGSIIDLAGGTVAYQSGYLQTSWLVGPGGRLYNVMNAPASLQYAGVFTGYTSTEARWNVTETFSDPLIAPSRIYQQGYTVGRDGGTLTVAAPTALLDGTIDAGVVNGPYQTQARNPAVTDPYQQRQFAVPLAGGVAIGVYSAVGLSGTLPSNVSFVHGGAPQAASIALTTPLPAGSLGNIVLDTGPLDAEALGTLSVTVSGSLDVESPVTLAEGGRFAAAAGTTTIDAGITAPGGTIALGNVFTGVQAGSGTGGATAGLSSVIGSTGDVTIGNGAALDASGVFTNALLDPYDLAGEAASSGGSVTIDTTGGVLLATGTSINVDSGAVLSAAGVFSGGTGGNVTLIADDARVNMVTETTSSRPLALGATITGYGVAGGGVLQIGSPGVLIAADGTRATNGLLPDGRTLLTPRFFTRGFQSYVVNGYGNIAPAVTPAISLASPTAAGDTPTSPGIAGVEIEAGVAVAPVVPVFIESEAAIGAASGAPIGRVATPYLSAEFLEDPARATVSQRAGASLTLQSVIDSNAPLMTTHLPREGGSILIDHGASVSVDAGQAIDVEAVGQITVDGALTAPSGSITLQNDAHEAGALEETNLQFVPGLSIWVGPDAVLDTAGIATTYTDVLGRRYADTEILAGGTISIGGLAETVPDGGQAGNDAISTDAFVYLAPGAILDADGKSARVDLAAGAAGLAPIPVEAAGDGGAIALNSTSGIILDGTMSAAAGAPEAAGGSLEIDLVTPTYGITEVGQSVTAATLLPDLLLTPRHVTISETHVAGSLPNGLEPGDAAIDLAFGNAVLGADQLAKGRFGSLIVTGPAFAAGGTGYGPDYVAFAGNVTLDLSRSIDISGVLSDTVNGARVRLSAPYVTLNGGGALAASAGQLNSGAFNIASTTHQTPIFSTPAQSARSAIEIDARDTSIQAGDFLGATITTTLSDGSASVTTAGGFGAARFVNSGDVLVGGELDASGALSFSAGQLSPTSNNTRIEVFPAVTGSGPGSTTPGSIAITQAQGALESPPLFAGGQLTLSAGTIVQAGTVRAPAGNLVFDATQSVVFAAGSETSISAAGETIIYGGTADGITYNVGGNAVTALQAGGTAGATPTLTVDSPSTAIAAGATLDLSGGGDLAGAYFLSGRGGSTDVLTQPFLAFSGSSVTQPTLAADPVYAILPGYRGATPSAPQTANVLADGESAAPAPGSEITVGGGIPGLAAGTYTLLPAYDALLPGAFRVQIQSGDHAVLQGGPSPTADLSTAADVALGVAGTSIRSTVPTVALFTSGADIRRLSGYDEENFSTFLSSEAALNQTPRGAAPEDAATLVLRLAPSVTIGAAALSVQGQVRFNPGAGGRGGVAEILPLAGPGGAASNLDIVADGIGPSTQADTITVAASDLDRLAPAILMINGTLSIPALMPKQVTLAAQSGGIVELGRGATLRASEVALLGGTVTVDDGGSIDTLGAGAAPYDASAGFTFYAPQGPAASTPASTAALVVGNGLLDFAPANGTGTIAIASGASLLTKGTVALVTNGAASIGTGTTIGAQRLAFAASYINILGADPLPAGTVLPNGITLTPSTLNALFAGGVVPGAPALQQLALSASGAIDFYGNVTFGLPNPSPSQVLEFDTPAIFGFGASGSRATIDAGTFVWNGVATGAGTPVAAGPTIAGGAGTGQGQLVVDASRIVLGTAPGTAPATIDTTSLPRTVAGFANVALDAATDIEAGGNGTLAIYQSQGAYVAGAYQGRGGTLSISTPMLTSVAGGILRISAGGAVTVSSPGGTPETAQAGGLGGEIDIQSGDRIAISTTVALPEGKLALTAPNDVTLGAGADIELAGQSTPFFDVAVPGPGGTLSIDTATGNVTQDASSTIDVSAPGAAAGTIDIAAPSGTVSLAGTILGGGARGGAIAIRAGTLADFSGLNRRLTAGSLFGSRDFELATGSLAIETADLVRAQNVSISVDDGDLTVDGAIDASGAAPGNITLSAGHDLTLTGHAILDAHGTVPQTDSNGRTIDSENTASVTLRVADGAEGVNAASTGANGTLTLAAGATIDVSAPAGVTCALGACGQVTLAAPRVGSTDGSAGDVAIAASGPLTIRGAGSIAVDGFWTITPAGGIVTQTVLDAANATNQAFIASALSGAGGTLDATLAGKLAGLAAYAGAFHLRPGVEIDSTGDLTIDGDLDTSVYRYASVNAASRQVAGIAGSGEPGVLVLRAADNLNVYGSVTDGFGQPVDGTGASRNPDDNGWVLEDYATSGVPTDQNIVVPYGATVPLGSGTVFSTVGTTLPTLDFDAVLQSVTFRSGASLPIALALPAALTLGAPVIAGGDVVAANGAVLFAKGSVLPAGTTLPSGTRLGAGFVLPSQEVFTNVAWPAGTSFAGVTGSVTLAADVTLAPGETIPADTELMFSSEQTISASGAQGILLRPQQTLADGDLFQGQVDAVSTLLPPGALSWSFDLVAGGNLAAADPTALSAPAALAAAGRTGNLVLSDTHFSVFQTTVGNPPALLPSWSVVRTGVGGLDLSAGGSLEEQSTYGIYTSGTQQAGVGSADEQTGVSFATTAQNDPTIDVAAASAVQAASQDAYPVGGGNVVIDAQGDIATTALTSVGINNPLQESWTGSWLLRQGDGTAAEPTAWWIQFGTYQADPSSNAAFAGVDVEVPVLAGFTGIGTLGGGNLTVTAGGDAGVAAALPTPAANSVSLAGAPLNTTYGDDGIWTHATSLQLAVASTAHDGVVAGGGALTLNVGGTLDGGASTGGVTAGSTIVALRGPVLVSAGTIGQVGALAEPALSSYIPVYTAAPTQALSLQLGDASAVVDTRDDLSLYDVEDPTRQPMIYRGAGGESAWFSLWQPETSVTLYSAGGDVSEVAAQGSQIYPPTLDVIAASGNIFTEGTQAAGSNTVLETAPSATGQIQFLAGGSIIAQATSAAGASAFNGLALDISGADPATLPTPSDPAYQLLQLSVSNLGFVDGNVASGTPYGALFAFGADTPTFFLHAADTQPARFYAAGGDIVGLVTGQRLLNGNYLAAKPVWVEAGQDIVNFGDRTDKGDGGVFWNNNATDISVLSAGRNIYNVDALVAGPGLLEVSAGGNFYQGGNSIIESVGPVLDVNAGNQDSGAGIDVLASLAGGAVDWTGFADLYLDPAHLANATTPLQDQKGKVVRTYQDQLLAFLQQRTSYTGDAAGALAYFQTLPLSLRQVLLLQIYYAELNQAGIDYNTAGSRFAKTYIEGNEAIASLFPATDLTGRSPAADAGITMFGASGIRTDFGGSLEFAVPYGGFEVGTPGVVPPSTAGLITQGSGDIDIYTYGSIPLGESRIFTTFGGNILVWMSSDGTVNLGQGSKSTVLFTPPRVQYDAYGDISLAPTVPSTGAGIATLAPVAGIPPGNVNIVTPVGTIDVGEAGLRSSGNVNLAALTVVNAANVQATGSVTGVPVVAVPNVAALAAASTAAGGSQNAAQAGLGAHTQRQVPSTITVSVTGTDEDQGNAVAPGNDDDEKKRKRNI